MIYFLQPFILFALVALIYLYLRRKQQHHVSTLVADAQGKKRQRQLLFIALCSIIIALARPVADQLPSEEVFDAQEYVVALDSSFSMQASDLQPTRYALAKQAIKKLLHIHLKDRFSLFVFTSNALLISPPTTDTTISMTALDAINPEYILTKSTSLRALLQTVSKISHKKKKLIIFTDGGDEHNLNTLLTICRKNNIVAYIVATASLTGSALSKDGHLIKDQYSSIVISRINPILKELAIQSGGRYYELTHQDLTVINDLSDDIANLTQQKESIQVQHYHELFYVPLFIALVLFFMAVTKLHQLYLLVPLMFLPYKVQAISFDFYYLSQAYQADKNDDFLTSAHAFEKVTPSVQSYVNIATAYYQAGHYKKSLAYFNQIQSADPLVKQTVFYGMGNCAVKLKRYDRAKNFYLKALALGEDKDALYNLNLLYKLHVKTGVNLIDMLPPKNPETKKNSSKSTAKDKDEKKQGGAKNSSKRSATSSNGAGDPKKSKEKLPKNKKASKSDKNNYKTSYKSYELINKGYTNEKEPW